MRLKPLILLLFLFSSVRISAGEIDSLLQRLSRIEEDHDTQELTTVYFDLARAYFRAEDYPNAIANHKKSIKLSKETSNLKYLGINYYSLGKTYQRHSNYSEALEAFTLSIGYDLDSYDGYSVSKAYSGIATIYRSLGEYEKAYDMQMKTLAILETKDDPTAIAGCHYNLAGIFFYQKQFKSALEHYNKAYEIIKPLDEPRLQYSCLGGLGSVYYQLGEKQKALEFNRNALELAKKIGYKTGIAYSLGNMGSQYTKDKNFEKAREVLMESIKIKKEIGDSWGQIGSLGTLAEVEMDSKNFKIALGLYKEALKLAELIDSDPRKAELYKDMSKCHQELGNQKQSYIFLNKYVELKDNLINEKTVEEMGRSKNRYEIQKKEHEISMLKKENQLLGLDKKVQKLQIYIFAIAAFFLLTFVMWFIRRLNFSKKMNTLLEDKNDLLNSKNDEIENANTELEKSNTNLTQFAYVASHDLKEPLRMIHSYTTLLKRKYGDSFDETGHEFMHYITDAVSRMQTLLDDLLDFSRAGSSKGMAGLIDTKDVVDMVRANLRHRFESEGATLILKADYFPVVKAHRTQLVQLLQNLLSNGIKFVGGKMPMVELNCVEDKGFYKFSVRDNGIGISDENKSKVFEMFTRLHDKTEYEGTGIGLATCKRIVDSLGGQIWLESEVGKGTTFFFTIPVPKEEHAMA